MYLKITLKGPARKLTLSSQIMKQIISAIKRNKSGKGGLSVGMDYDNTMVTTKEKERIFHPLTEDSAGVIEPMSGLGMLGIPIGVFTGNKPSYIDPLCVEKYRSWLYERNKVEAMENFRVYAQNATWLTSFNNFGEEVPKVSEAYAKQYLFPPEHIEAIKDAYTGPLQKTMAGRFMAEKPLVIRPAGSKEVHYAYGPIFENRGGVQLSWIAVPGEVREEVIAAAYQRLDKDIRMLYRSEPGGEYSIDINHLHVAKNNGTIHFREEMRASLLLYFGDSVYKRGNYEGNDLPVVRDKNAIVFAVNQNQEEIPEHKRIIKAGVGPDATRDWLTWFLVKYVSVRLAIRHTPDVEKSRIVDAIIAAGLDEDVKIR